MRLLLVATCLLAGCYQRTHHPYYPEGPPTASGEPMQAHHEVCVTSDAGRMRCAKAHAGFPQGYQPGYVGDGYASGYTQGETCLDGTDGVVACGYDCKVGTAGIANCANVSGGSCSTASDGLVYCDTVR